MLPMPVVLTPALSTCERYAAKMSSNAPAYSSDSGIVMRSSDSFGSELCSKMPSLASTQYTAASPSSSAAP